MTRRHSSGEASRGGLPGVGPSPQSLRCLLPPLAPKGPGPRSCQQGAPRTDGRLTGCIGPLERGGWPKLNASLSAHLPTLRQADDDDEKSKARAPQFLHRDLFAVSPGRGSCACFSRPHRRCMVLCRVCVPASNFSPKVFLVHLPSLPIRNVAASLKLRGCPTWLPFAVSTIQSLSSPSPCGRVSAPFRVPEQPQADP